MNEQVMIYQRPTNESARAIRRRTCIQWLVGPWIATAIIGVTSPLFVRSYLPLSIDPVRGVATPRTGQTYRWRSEGYADTTIGPMGMPGRASLGEPDRGGLRVALWGDSQAEGVCVPDERKLFAQAERLGDELGEQRLTVFPLARSGDDARVWFAQMRSVGAELDIDLHVILLVDLPDMRVLADGSRDLEKEPEPVAQARIASWLPAFVIEPARRLITTPSGAARTLRFTLGPVTSESANDSTVASEVPSLRDNGTASSIDWSYVAERMAASADRPLCVLYAPPFPRIVGGRVERVDRNRTEFGRFAEAAKRANVRVVDVSDDLLRSAESGNWPHGFHNGKIGVGHLNASGYEVIASRLVAAANELGPVAE